MTTTDTTEIYISRLPQELLMTLLTYQSDLSKPALSSRSEPPPPDETGGLRCTVLYLPGPRKRISDDSLRRRIPNFPLMRLVGNSLLRRFAKLSARGIGIAYALFFSFYSFFFVLGLYFLFFEGSSRRGDGLHSSSLCMCATVVYPQTHPGLLHVRRATRMSFFLYYI